jgi:ABC-type transport system involved in multi-copper enzyme maturation permease subunit
MVETLDRLLYTLLRFNPAVAWHELRLRMRVGKAFVLLGAYVLLAALAVVLPVVFTAWERTQYGGGMQATDLGRVGLHALTYVQLTLIFIVLPAYAASTIAAERERQTLEMLRATLLTPWDVVTGKLLSVLAFGVILLATTVPVAAWCLLLGGVSPTEVLRVYVILLMTACWVSALGVLMSAHAGRAVAAIVSTYGVILGATVLSAAAVYAFFMWAMLSMHGGTPILGAGVATLAVGIAVIATAVVTAALLRWLAGRVRPLRGAAQSGLLALALVIILIGVLMTVQMPLVEKLSTAAPTALLLVNPYAGAAAVLEESAARELISSTTPPGRGTPATDLNGYVCAVLTWLYLVAAVLLWIAAVQRYARHSAT